MIKLSIITPAYNAGATIRRCAASLLRSRREDFEWIIVDDASADDTFLIISQIAADDSRVKVIRNERNMGPSGARYRAFASIKGEFVTFLDADDTLDKGAVSRMIEAVEPGKNEIYLLGLRLRFKGLPLKITLNSYEQGGRNEFAGAELLGLLLSGEKIQSNMIGKIYPATLIKTHCGEAPPFAVAEDYIFNMRMAPYAARMCVLPLTVYNWRHSGLGEKYYLRGWDEYVAAMKYAYAELPGLSVAAGADMRQMQERFAGSYLYNLRESIALRMGRGDKKPRLLAFIEEALSKEFLAGIDSWEGVPLKADEMLNAAEAHRKAHRLRFLVNKLTNRIFG